ncbi:hypothetical protein CMO93_00405 [Candidatus Woesearchaeota archaeon]|nr:hypothetical protein [Candidatus Woesearchaeota archaeon]
MARLGKKGIFLTFIAISLTAAFIIIFTPSNVELKKDIPVIKARVSNINEFVVDLEKVYLERALEATGTKAIIALIEYMENQNEFLLNFEDDFKDVLLTGNLDDTSIMVGDTYNDWINKIKTTADSTFSIDVDFDVVDVNDVQVYQIRPWFLSVDANVSFTITSETASWDKEVLITTKIDIERFNDPYYLINTGGAYINRINKSSVKFNEWNLDKVKDHISYGTYTHFQDSKAPNFIMRFTNTSFNSSCCGIESLVNPNGPTIADEVESYADYLYFNHTYQNRCDDIFNVTIIWDEFNDFELEFEHLVLYNVSLDDVEACQ